MKFYLQKLVLQIIQMLKFENEKFKFTFEIQVFFFKNVLIQV